MADVVLWPMVPTAGQVDTSRAWLGWRAQCEGQQTLCSDSGAGEEGGGKGDESKRVHVAQAGWQG
jgi:hypothetical protein